MNSKLSWSAASPSGLRPKISLVKSASKFGVKQTWMLPLLLALAGSGLNDSCPETQSLCFNLKGRKMLSAFTPGSTGSMGKGPAAGWGNLYLPPQHVGESDALFSYLCLVGTGNDR